MKTKFVVEKPLEERAEKITEFCLREHGDDLMLCARAVGGKDTEWPILIIHNNGVLRRIEQDMKVFNELGLRSDIKNRIYIEENP